MAQDAIAELGETSAFGALIERLRSSAANYPIPYDERAACSALTFALARRRLRPTPPGARRSGGNSTALPADNGDSQTRHADMPVSYDR